MGFVLWNLRAFPKEGSEIYLLVIYVWVGIMQKLKIKKLKIIIPTKEVIVNTCPYRHVDCWFIQI